MASQILGTVEITSDDPENFQVKLHLLQLGAVRISSLTLTSSCGINRTAKMIRQSDPELFEIALPLSGQAVATQGQKKILVQSHDLAFYDTSRPFHIQAVPEAKISRGVLMNFPRTLLPLPLHRVERLTATSLSGSNGIGAIFSGFITRLIADTNQYRIADGSRLGTNLIDLLATQLAHELDDERSLPLETTKRALLMQIQAFIQQHLADPQLSPNTISAAHNISTRTLHRLFETHDSTVAEWIRLRRLDRCRRDLADPMLHDRPIHAIAARWGFADTAHFTRAFRAAYKLTPRDYRQQTQPDPAALDQAPKPRSHGTFEQQGNHR